MNTQEEKAKRRAELKAKIQEKKIQRSNKAVKDNILSKTLKDMGIDKERLMKDLQNVQVNDH